MPAMKPTLTFPGVDKLPDSARSVLEFFFPQGHEIYPPSSTGVPAMGIAGVGKLGGRGALKEALKIIKSYSDDFDPIKKVMLERVTPVKVPHRTPINVPKGFELPKEFGPNYSKRPESLINNFVASRTPPNKSTLVGESVGARRAGNRAASKIPDDQVRKIREMFASGKTSTEISKLLGINRMSIDDIGTGSYRWVK